MSVILLEIKNSLTHLYLDLDHTADIQVHAWGTDLEEAFIQTSHAMINYMYERELVEESFEREIEVDGNSLNRLLYNFLEEILYIFSCDPYMAVKTVEIKNIIKDESDLSVKYLLKATCKGEEYLRSKHSSKTEIKAVTFSNMRINITESVNIYVIFDI